jgi:4-amino-4-deoxy-L-arabinose transferase-like glycosyltransferase
VLRRTELILCTLILLGAAWLRIYRLSDLPPGWRDDEVVETTVHAALVLAGRAPLYFPQAEGHEPLYHYLSGGWMALAGRSLFSVRLLSALLGVISVAALYRLTRRLFGPSTALLAAAGLAVSFWGLMYARFKLRHVAALAPMLLAFELFWRAGATEGSRQSARAAGRRPFADDPQAGRTLAYIWAGLAGLCLALALYTYYAARVVPVMLLAFVVYMAVFHRAELRARWRAWAVTAGVAAVLVLPLGVAIARTPGGEARIGVVGQPLRALLNGDPGPALANTRETLGMFAFTGDPEALYNIPGRPVFEALGATLFAVGVAVSAWRWRQPRHAFMLLWLVGGLAPAFVSVPAASLGHTITAQLAFYVFPALGLAAVSVAARGWRSRPWVTVFLALVFLGVTASRDLRDYFVRWPALPEVRRLYRADLHAAAPSLRALPAGSALGLTSHNLHPADPLALALETDGRDLQPRVFNPAWAWLQPAGDWPVLLRSSAPAEGAFGLAPLETSFALRPSDLEAWAAPEMPLAAAFENGWVCTGYTLAKVDETGALALYTYWRIGPDYVATPPRPVEVLAGTPVPLKFFSHLLDPAGAVLAGDDRLDVDPAYLRAGDEFIQLFVLSVPAELAAGEYRLQVGVYDPQTGARVLTETGEDRLVLTSVTWP